MNAINTDSGQILDPLRLAICFHLSSHVCTRGPLNPPTPNFGSQVTLATTQNRLDTRRQLIFGGDPH